MSLSKYKYYFKKPKSEIVKDILSWLAIGGAICIAASSPYFIRNILNGYKRIDKYPKKKIADTFHNLKRQGLLEIKTTNHQIYIHLTEKGKKKAGMLQIDNLKINKPQKWDRQWRIVIFDITEPRKIYREAFRGKIKELGFYPLQKSVWAHPFECQAEIELLKDFFALSEKELQLITADKISNDKKLKEFFKLI